MAGQMMTERIRRDGMRAGERLRGLSRAVLRMSSSRTAETQIAGVSRLPCEASAVALQDASGNMLALTGYSQAGGPDIGS